MIRQALKFCQKLIICTVCASVASLPWYGVATAETSDHMKNAAQKAQEMKGAALSDIMRNINDVGSSAQDLAPNTTVNPNGKSMSVEEIQELMGIHKKDEEYTKRGNARILELESRYKTAGADDPEAAAYGVLKGAGSMQKGTITSNDPMFNQTKDFLASADSSTKDLASCEAINDYLMQETVVHEPIYEQCSQIEDKTGSCVVDHKYSFVEPISHVDGPFNIGSCGEGCVSIWLGKVGDNYLPGGTCSLYEFDLYFKVRNPDAIESAKLDYAAYDDRMQVYIGPKGQERKIYDSPTPFPYDDNGNRNGEKCEYGTHWIWDPERTGPGCTESSCAYLQEGLAPIDITDDVKRLGKDAILHFKLRDAIGGEGEAYAKITVRFDPSKTLQGDLWSPPGCIQMAKAISDGFAKGSVQCVASPQGEENGCITSGGFKLCESNFNSSPIPGISYLCQKVSVTADYSSFYKGDMDCFTAADGTLVCPKNEGGGVTDECKSLAESGCVFIKGECAEGGMGKSGNCYVYTNTYDCGYDRIVTTPISEKGIECSGDLACLGDDCVVDTYVQSTDFAQAAALLNVAQQASKDMICTGKDQTEDVTCTLFSGEAMQCKKAVGGIQDCCEVPTNANLIDYLMLTFSLYKADSAMMSLDVANVPTYLQSVVGSYQTLHNSTIGVVKEGMSAVTEPLTSFMGNIAGEVKTFFNTAKVFINGVKEYVKNAMKSLLTEIFKKMGIQSAVGEAAGGALASEAGKEFGKEVGKDVTANTAEGLAGSVVEGFTTMLSVVGYVYLAYQVAKLVIQTVYKCETKEYELASNKALRQCHYVGSYCKSKVLGACIEKRYSYCCYKSPLGRILQEQIREQIYGTQNFGSAKEPQCEGLSVEDFGKVDWEKVDLSEWVAMAQEAGFLGGDVSKFTPDGLTGSGSLLNYEGNRLDVIERTQQRMDGIPVDDIRDEYVKQFVMPGDGETAQP